MENNNFFITQGDVLLLLVKKDRRKVPEIASAMNCHEKTLPTYYKMTFLPTDVIESACQTFGVSPELFDIGKFVGTVSRMQEENKLRDARESSLRMQIEALMMKFDAVQMEVRALREENLILQKPTTN